MLDAMFLAPAEGGSIDFNRPASTPQIEEISLFAQCAFYEL